MDAKDRKSRRINYLQVQYPYDDINTLMVSETIIRS